MEGFILILITFIFISVLLSIAINAGRPQNIVDANKNNEDKILKSNIITTTLFERENDLREYLIKFYEHQIINIIRNGKMKNIPMARTELLTTMTEIHKELMDSSSIAAEDYKIPEYRIRIIYQDVFKQMCAKNFDNI